MHCTGLQPHLLASNGMQCELVIGQEHAVIPDKVLPQPCACLEQICEGELPVLDELAAVPEERPAPHMPGVRARQHATQGAPGGCEAWARIRHLTVARMQHGSSAMQLVVLPSTGSISGKTQNGGLWRQQGLSTLTCQYTVRSSQDSRCGSQQAGAHRRWHTPRTGTCQKRLLPSWPWQPRRGWSRPWLDCTGC